MPDDLEEDFDLNALDDGELTEPVHDDLYNGLKEEVEEATRIFLGRGWPADRVLNDALVEGMRIVEDEPVQGYPLPILPGHTSPGRLERVLSDGRVRGHDRAGSAGLRRSRRRLSTGPHFRWLRRRHQRHRRQRRQLSHAEPGRLRAADAHRLRAGDADFLPRQEPHRDPGRHPGRFGDGRVQHALPNRRRRAGGRSAASATGLRSRLHDAARNRPDAPRRAPFPERSQRDLRAASVLRRRGESFRAALRVAPSPAREKVAAGAQFIQTQYCYDVPRPREFMQRVDDLGLLDRVFILVGVGPLRSVKAAEWMRTHVPGIHIKDDIVRRIAGAEKPTLEGRKLCVELIQEIRQIKA